MRKGALIIGLGILFAVSATMAQVEGVEQTDGWFRWDPVALAFFGAGIAAVLAGIGSSIGIGIVGGMANGALQERPELFGRFIPLAAMPGTQGIYGIVIAVVILGKITPGMS
ncbi:hypothetical protein DRQ27_01490, partial [bacterium]